MTSPDPRSVERDTVAQQIASRLRDREIPLSGDESSDQLADLLTAVERFEHAVARLGGDSMTNAPDSNDPDAVAFVLPKRRADESVGDYGRRVTAAAERLLESADPAP
ncbi:MAG TPA: hypothetical protein VNA89_16225 [Gemmatimonadaceae bacterium]|nr:hypothetical protein [Gemmatimonadaceae bacterium]